MEGEVLELTLSEPETSNCRICGAETDIGIQVTDGEKVEKRFYCPSCTSLMLATLETIVKRGFMDAEGGQVITTAHTKGDETDGNT